MSEVIDGVTYYVVRFLNERGTSEWGRAYVEYGGDATDQAPTPKVREGKVFTGWNHDITYITKDKTVWATYADAVTVTFRNYLSNEGLSLIENAAYLGLPIPSKLKAVLEQLHNRAEKEDSDHEIHGE